jgi:hypothetical protein
VKKIGFTIFDAIVSVIYLVVGLFILNFVEQKLISNTNNFSLMVLILIADLIILFVLYRQFIARKMEKLSPRFRNILLLIAQLSQSKNWSEPRA